MEPNKGSGVGGDAAAVELRPSNFKRDLVWGSLLLGVAIGAMIWFDGAEAVFGFSRRFEGSELDEFILALFPLSIVVAWFSYRRWQEVLAATRALLESRDALQAANERFSLAVSGSSAGVWDWDILRDRTYLSGRFKALLGYRSETPADSMAAWRTLIHGQDADRAGRALHDHLALRTPYNLEIRLETKAAGFRWYQVVGQACWGDDGKPVRMAGSLVDITDRKLAEEDLERSKQDLEGQVAELEDLRDRIENEASHAVGLAEQLNEARGQLHEAVESISEGFALWDSNDRLVMCNNRYRAIYPNMDDVLVTGLHFDAFVRHAFERGLFALENEDLEEAVASRVARHRNSVSAFEHDLADGRRIRVSKRRTDTGHVVGIYSDFTERRAAEATIERMALEDSLTGLPNRTQFYANLESGLALTARTDWLLGVMLLDLDHFKDVNDTLGHAAGDELLRQVATRLSNCLRKGDSLARLGGDEFAVIVNKAKAPDDITRLATRITDTIRQPFMIGSSEVHVGTSIGITIYPNDQGSPEQLLRNADLALYRVKGDGRGAYQLYDEKMHVEVQTRRNMEDDLRRAIDEGQFYLVYQPQFSLARDALIGAEVLLRWHHPERGNIPPAVFIPAAESSRLILPLGDWLFDTVLGVMKDWEVNQARQVPLSVNLSPLQFRQQGFTEDLGRRLRASGAEPGLLELEITETMTLQSGDNTANILTNIKALGVGLAIDDFGTGYSSLGRLKEMPVDRLKIDQSFVRGILVNEVDAAITRAMIQLGHSLGMAVIAEGVETVEQRRFLVEHGCDAAQGYYYSEPLKLDAFSSFVENWDRRGSSKDVPARKVAGE